MPVSPIGNMNFVNQNMAYPATQASNELAKEGFAATLNMAEFNEKEKTFKEEIKEKAEQEEKKKKHNQEAKTSDDEKNEEDESKDPNFKDAQSIHRLDISI